MLNVPITMLWFGWNGTVFTCLLKVLFFILSLIKFAIYGAKSAVSHVVLREFKACILHLGNYYLFGSNLSTTSICGTPVSASHSQLAVAHLFTLALIWSSNRKSLSTLIKISLYPFMAVTICCISLWSLFGYHVFELKYFKLSRLGIKTDKCINLGKWLRSWLNWP